MPPIQGWYGEARGNGATGYRRPALGDSTQVAGTAFDESVQETGCPALASEVHQLDRTAGYLVKVLKELAGTVETAVVHAPAKRILFFDFLLAV